MNDHEQDPVALMIQRRAAKPRHSPGREPVGAGKTRSWLAVTAAAIVAATLLLIVVILLS